MNKAKTQYLYVYIHIYIYTHRHTYSYTRQALNPTEERSIPTNYIYIYIYIYLHLSIHLYLYLFTKARNKQRSSYFGYFYLLFVLASVLPYFAEVALEEGGRPASTWEAAAYPAYTRVRPWLTLTSWDKGEKLFLTMVLNHMPFRSR